MKFLFAFSVILHTRQALLDFIEKSIRSSLCLVPVNRKKPFSRFAVSQNLPQGFSLAELLVVVVAGALILIALSSFLVDYLYQSRSLLTSQKLREEASRASYLIQIEASEARESIYPASLNLCGSTFTPLFGFEIPKAVGPYASNLVSYVYYYQDGNDLKRCGPPILQDGTLDHDAPVVSSFVSRGMLLSLSTCGGKASNPAQVAYSITFPSISSYVPSCTIARSRSIFVCNPQINAVNEIGDC